MGRPTEHSPELAKSICERLAAGESLSQICTPDEMPAKSTVCLWVIDDREGFAEQYAKARRLQAELRADEIFDIADDGSNDWQTRTNSDGQEYDVPNPEVVGRSRLRVDTRKWYLSKVLPKIYGEKVTNELVLPEGVTFNMNFGGKP